MSTMPVFVKAPGSAPPEHGMHYIVARNGLFMRVQNDWLDATISVKEFQAFEPETPRARLLLPAIDALVFAQVLRFFEAVYELHGTEAAVLLHYSKEQGWAFTVPPQKVSWAYVHYEMTERLAGYRCVGTMHSHGNMSAGHSGTDVQDEAAFDGVHITLGNVTKKSTFTMQAELVCRGQRFKLPVSQIGGVISPTPQVTETEQFQGRWSRNTIYSLTAIEQMETWTPPEEWFTRLTIYTIF